MKWKPFKVIEMEGGGRGFRLESWDSKDEILIRTTCLNCGQEFNRDRFCIRYDNQEELTARAGQLGRAGAHKYKEHKCAKQ